MTPKTRRSWIKGTAGAAAGTLTLFHVRPSALAAPTATIRDTKIISPEPELYNGWPTLARRKNGELLLVSSGGRELHVCPFGRVELMRSKDGGQTWSYPRVVMDGPIDDRDAGVLETEKGTILVTTFTSLAYESPLAKMKDGEQKDRWLAVHNRVSAEERQEALDVWMMRSTDGGVTFSGRYKVPANSPHGPIQLSDGRLLYAGKALWEEGKKIGVSESSDDGKTWTPIHEIPPMEGHDPINYHELHAVEAADGKLIAQIRNHNKPHAGETLQSESSDGGKTWTKAHPIGVWGLPSHLLRLQDDRLLMTYGHRRAPLGNQARISEDHGATWSEPIILSGDGASGDLGYPSTIQMDDGSLVTVWYEKMKGSPRAVLRQARWEIG